MAPADAVTSLADAPARCRASDPVAAGDRTAEPGSTRPCIQFGRIAAGNTDNLVQRAAAVALKERRRLVIVHRESPRSMIEIDAMAKATEAGAIVLPLAPGFHLRPKSIEELLEAPRKYTAAPAKGRRSCLCDRGRVVRVTLD